MSELERINVNFQQSQLFILFSQRMQPFAGRKLKSMKSFHSNNAKKILCHFIPFFKFEKSVSFIELIELINRLDQV